MHSYFAYEDSLLVMVTHSCYGVIMVPTSQVLIKEMKELIDYLKKRKSQKEISEFCTLNNIKWKFIPQHSHHFGGIWETAVKSFKTHLKHILGNVRLTFEEMYTVLSQIKACMNSCPLYYIDTGTFWWASTGQPSLFDSVNSHKTELKWAGPNPASMVCTTGPAQFGSAQFGPFL